MTRAAATCWLLFGTAMAQAPTPSPAPVAAPAAAPQDHAAVPTTVGRPGEFLAVVLPGSEFEPVPATPASKLVVRIAAVDKHGTAHRYDIEFVGLEPGDYDLGDFLQRKDRTEKGPLPKLPIQVRSVLAAGQVEPTPLPSVPVGNLGGYQRLLWIAGGVWVCGLIAILFVGRRRRSNDVVTAPPPTLADHLRPLVADAIAGNLAEDRRHELERMLLTWWRRRLDLQQRPASEAIATLRAHPEAGALLRALEQWLHAPPQSRKPVDVAALLAPYERVPAADGAEPR